MRNRGPWALGGLLLQVASLSAHAEDTLCGVRFDAERFGFEVQAVQPDEEQGCGRFLISKSVDAESEPRVVSIAVLAGPASDSLKSSPSSFEPTRTGSLKFRKPKAVKDERSFYFATTLRVLSEKRFSTPDGEMYLAEYKRRVVRLKRASSQEEAAVHELQRCFEAVKTTPAHTVLLSGCDLAKHGPVPVTQAFNLLESAKLAVLATAVSPLHADGLPLSCGSPLLEDRALRQIECVDEKGLVVQRYEESSPPTAYATDLDKRTVAVARSEQVEALMQAAGIVSKSRRQALPRTLLLQPPMKDQVHHRAPPRAARKHKQWQLWTEEVQYGAQGGSPGFVIDCVTAIRTEPKYATAVAECFPLEERTRFLSTLDKIK